MYRLNRPRWRFSEKPKIKVKTKEKSTGTVKPFYIRKADHFSKSCAGFTDLVVIRKFEETKLNLKPNFGGS